MLTDTIRQLVKHKDLLWYLSVRNLKVRYKNSTLGFLWSLLNPLLLMLIYFVFIKLLRFSVDLPFLLTGVIAWHFTNLCVGDALGTVTGNTNLIKKVYFPRLVLPLSMILANAVNTLLSFVVLAGMLLLFKVQITGALLALPAVFLVHCLFCLGLSLILSTLSVYFDDTKHIVSAGMTAWFFMSPIIYPASMVPERFIPYFILNPMAGILSAYRYCFLGTVWPGWGMRAFIAAFICAAVLCAAGLWFFEKYQRFFADEL